VHKAGGDVVGMGGNGWWLAVDGLGAEGYFGTFCVPKKYRKKGTPAELA